MISSWNLLATETVVFTDESPAECTVRIIPGLAEGKPDNYAAVLDATVIVGLVGTPPVLVTAQGSLGGVVNPPGNRGSSNKWNITHGRAYL